MIRARFYIKFKDCGNDYRPVKWPIKYPYWCTGESVEQIKGLWPEAYMIECEEVNEITFTTRFPKPKWYNSSSNC